MIKTEKLFEDFRKYAIEETGADCAEDEEEVYEGGARQIAHLSKKEKAEMQKEPEPAKKEKELDEGNTPPEQLRFKMPNGSVITADFVGDDGGYYDLYDQDGNHLNSGEPWWLERGIPSEEEIVKIYGEVDEGGFGNMGHQEEEPQGNDSPSQDVYTMLDVLRGKLEGTPLVDDVLAIMDKMDAHPEMTDTKYPEPPMAEKLRESKRSIKLKINSKKKK